MPQTPEGVQPHSLDIVVLIFVLSALHPEEWTRAVANVRHLLKPDGIVLIRDYGRHDLPQLRFGKGRMMADNLYGAYSSLRRYIVVTTCARLTAPLMALPSAFNSAR